MPIRDEVKQLDRMDVRLIIENELSRFFRLLPCFAGEAVERHHVIPNARVGGLLQVVLDHGFLDMLVHQAEHTLVGRFHSIVQRTAAGFGG